jgi:hypothetical protein
MSYSLLGKLMTYIYSGHLFPNNKLSMDADQPCKYYFDMFGFFYASSIELYFWGTYKSTNLLDFQVF